MTTDNPSSKEFMAEIESLRLRLEEAEETLRAIGSGEVDAFVVSTPEGNQQVFTLKGAEQPYRILVESMNEGAATIAADGTILYCNKRLSTILNIPLENLVGTKLGSYVDPKNYLTYAALLENCTQQSISEEITVTTAAGNSIPVFMSCCANDISGILGISVVVTDLTLQQRNAEILASEKFSTSIIEQSSEAMVVCDAKGMIIRASHSAYVLCGTNPLLKQFNKIFPLQLTESGKKFSLVQHMRAGKVTSSEVEFKRDDEQIFNLLLNASTLRNLQNLDVGTVITLTDITDRKTTEMELHKSEVRLQSAYSHLQVVNEELQVASEELQSQSEELKKQNQELQELWQRTKLSEETIRISEERHRVLAETMLQGVVHQDASGKIITMNPAAKRILGKSQDELLGNSSVEVEHDTIRENGELYPGLEHPTMVALRTGLPVRSVIMGVYNPKLEEYRWIGIDAVPVFHPGEDRPSEVYSIFGDITERKTAEKALQKAHDELEQRVTERTMELSYMIDHLQSEIRERELAEKKLREETAERLLAMEALREKERMLIQQSRLAAMGEMIGNIAHQWRQPLNILGLYTQSLRAFYGTPNFNKEFLDTSVAKSMKIIQHMSQTINDFRNYFKPDKEKTYFCVHEVIKNTLSLLEGSFQNPKINIEISGKVDLVINSYQNEFSQVLLNILLNARDALIERQIENGQVKINLYKKDDSVIIAIADNAGGIPEDIINKVFDPYFTTKGPQQGTGVGLFMSKNIIENNMGGRLSVRNVDNGAEFRIEVCNDLPG